MEIITHGTVHIAYVNVYAVGRQYGGPEEGGWWYDTGEPVECHRIAAATEEGLRSLCDEVATRLEADYPRTGRRSSVLGGEDYGVYVEAHEARAFPDERPYYE